MNANTLKSGRIDSTDVGWQRESYHLQHFCVCILSYLNVLASSANRSSNVTLNGGKVTTWSVFTLGIRFGER